MPPNPCFRSRDVFLAHPLCQAIQFILGLFYRDLGRNKWYWYVHADISGVQLKMATN